MRPHEAPAAVGTVLFGTLRLSPANEGFAAALAAAHAEHLRPRCMCLIAGVEMYVARLGEGFILKRMPGTGSRHAPHCPSYEPPPEASGLGQVLGSAIHEDPATGTTALRLAFSLSKLGGRAAMPAPGTPSGSAGSDGTKLTLRALLHYLWDQAELTRWHPGWASKRSWGLMRRQLMLAAENKVARGQELRTRLYIPEPFSVDHRDALNARRTAQWRYAIAAAGQPQRLLLLIGEVKEIVPARYGHKVVVKHVPYQGFAIDEQLYRSLGRRFDAELALWGSADAVHMVLIATFSISEAGIPAINAMALMPVTPQWLPVEDAFERQLVERLVAEDRAFIKGLRYNLHRDQCSAAATLTDTGGSGSLLFVIRPGTERGCDIASALGTAARRDAPVWIWKPSCEAMPALPGRGSVACLVH
jgi:Protein of unknown function (DUF1173)